MEYLVFEAEVFKLYLLVLVRFSGLVVSAPVLGSANFPLRLKIGLAAMCAFLVTPTLPSLTETLPSDALGYTSFAVGEAVIGLMIGFTITMVFAAVQVAGQVIDMLSGFALMNVFNPAIETQVPIFGFFLFVIAVLYLIVWGGHRLMLQALASTFDTVPLGGFVANPALFREIVSWGSAMFYDALVIAAPAAAALLLAYVTMGLLGRVVPQIQLFVVGFPLTIALGLLSVSFMLGVYTRVLDGMFYHAFRNVETLIRGIS